MFFVAMTKDYADTVGAYAEKVENRSLLLSKFVFSKEAGQRLNGELQGAAKNNDAPICSLMRITKQASNWFGDEAQKLERPKKGSGEFSRQKAEIYRKLEESARDASRATADFEALQPKHAENFKTLLQKQYGDDRCRVLKAQLKARLAINLAEGILVNAGISLDRIFGLPVVAGSAIKGVTRAVALAELREKADLETFENFARVFGFAESDFDIPKKAGQAPGDLASFYNLLEASSLPKDDDGKPLEERRGAVVFLPASPANQAEIAVDITTVHTPDYYCSGIESDLKNEQPKPNLFPVVDKGAEFDFCILLTANGTPDLLDVTERWLSNALQDWGLGAKTAAGYGWFKDLNEEHKEAERTRQALLAQQAAELEKMQKVEVDEKLLEELLALPEDQLRGKLNRFRGAKVSWEESEVEQRTYLEAALKSGFRQKINDLPKKTQQGIKNLAEKFGEDLS
ncbi:MAG: type III-B CRISPR module RAMP protein Cmr6 [Lentisphaeria bacterium]|nr:type III-B CRISPR module RAMP protein Cmr6 [Lentisphaeria bacterium]